MKKLLTALLGVSLLAGCAQSASSADAASSAVSEASSETVSSVVSEEPAADAGMVTLTDHADTTVTVPTNPERVIILDILPLPSTLTVYLDSASSIIAMQPASYNAAKNGVLSELYPEILNASTDIMNGEDVNVETLLSMEPDIVFYNAGNKPLRQQLDNAGLTAVGVSPTKWNYDAIRTYNEWISLLDQIYPDRASERTALVQNHADELYKEVQNRTKDVEEKQKVLFLFQYSENSMITSGKSFFGQWWCDAVNARNAAEEVAADNSNAIITMEQVYEWNPDVIIITNFTPAQPEDLYNNTIGNDDWSSVKAVQDKRVYKMPLGVYRTYTPGIDTPMTLEWMGMQVYPELFEDTDLAADVRDYYDSLFGVKLTDEQIDKMYHPDIAASSLR
ncbi:MAG: ABC transporter substrate-binding protein [Solobacterium sp.]|nr:ABC transporter substrate-binding protein [Solobacterium sp.]